MSVVHVSTLKCSDKIENKTQKFNTKHSFISLLHKERSREFTWYNQEVRQSAEIGSKKNQSYQKTRTKATQKNSTMKAVMAKPQVTDYLTLICTTRTQARTNTH